MKKRQSIFAQILVFFLCGWVCAESPGISYHARTVVEHPVLPMTFSAGTVDRIAIQDFIRDRMQTLNRLVGTPPGAKAVDCRLHFAGTAEKASLKITRRHDGIELTVFGPFSLWKEDFSLQCRLSGALLLAQFGIVPDMADRLPVWIQGAIESNLRAGSYPSLFRKGRYLPGLRHVLIAGKLPDFRSLPAMDPEFMNPEIRGVYFDLCRALLEIAYQADPAKSVLRDYILMERQSNPRTACSATVERILAGAGRKYALQNAIDFSGLADAECAQRYWELRAELLAFNRAYSYDPEDALVRFQRFRQVTVTEQKGEKSVSRVMDIADLPGWEGEKNARDLLILQKTKEFDRISGCFSDEHTSSVRELSRQLHDLLLDSPWRLGGDLKGALAAMEQSLQTAILRDRFAAQQEEKSCSALLLFRDELAVIRRPDSPFLSVRALRFVDDVERNYLWEKEGK